MPSTDQWLTPRIRILWQQQQEQQHFSKLTPSINPVFDFPALEFGAPWYVCPHIFSLIDRTRVLSESLDLWRVKLWTYFRCRVLEMMKRSVAWFQELSGIWWQVEMVVNSFLISVSASIPLHDSVQTFYHQYLRIDSAFVIYGITNTITAVSAYCVLRTTTNDHASINCAQNQTYWQMKPPKRKQNKTKKKRWYCGQERGGRGKEEVTLSIGVWISRRFSRIIHEGLIMNDADASASPHAVHPVQSSTRKRHICNAMRLRG